MRKLAIPLVPLLVLALIIGAVGCGGDETMPTPMPTPDLEREAIISFTQQALEIEAKRNEMMEFFASLGESSGWNIELDFVGRYFIEGISEDLAAQYTQYVIPPGFEGMQALYRKLLLLDCPHAIRSVRDILVHIYNSEIQLAELQSLRNRDKDLGDEVRLILWEITKDNFYDFEDEIAWLNYRIEQKIEEEGPDYFGEENLTLGYFTHLTQSSWGQLQKRRQQLYSGWVETLQEHGIDPAKEGFTELIGQE